MSPIGGQYFTVMMKVKLMYTIRRFSLICYRIIRHKSGGISPHSHTRSVFSSDFVFSYTLYLVSPAGFFFYISIIISCFTGFCAGGAI